MSQNDADGMANSVDPDQTAPPLGAVWSGSALFTQAYLSENLGPLRYVILLVLSWGGSFAFIPSVRVGAPVQPFKCYCIFCRDWS